MLPIVDTPIIFHVVNEAVKAGIEDIVIIAGRNKVEIEDFFDVSYEVEDLLEKQGKVDLLEKIKHLSSLANIISVRQKQALGLGHAVHCAKPVVGDEPFAVLLGDEISYAETADELTTSRLANVYADTGLSTVAVMKVADSEVHKYGIIAAENFEQVPFKITDVIEKPSLEQAPSRYALPGRYVFTKQLFEFLEGAKPGKNGEIQLTDAMTQVAQNEGMLAIESTCARYDAGDKLGFLTANIEFALRDPELNGPLTAYLKKVAQR